MVIETERLTLRDILESDFDAIQAYASDLEVVQYVPWGPNTSQVTLDFIEKCRSTALATPRLEYVLAVVPRDGVTLVGTVGLYLPAADAHQAMLGYAYDRAAWGRGLATEAAEPMLELAFDVLGLDRVWASCDPDNRGSARVLEKVGMTLEGRLRHDQRIRGVLRDSLVWGILRDEWDQRSTEDEG